MSKSDKMALVEVGRVCIKKYGRDAGSRAVVTVVENGGANVRIMTAMRQKERKCNTSHLEFLNEVIDVKNKDIVMKTLGVQEATQRRAAAPAASTSEKPRKKA